MFSSELSITRNPEFFRLLLWHICGITYPAPVFHRRVKALTKDDKKRIEKKLNEKWVDFCNMKDVKAFSEFLEEEIDSVISERAEINKDPWK